MTTKKKPDQQPEHQDQETEEMPAVTEELSEEPSGQKKYDGGAIPRKSGAKKS